MDSIVSIDSKVGKNRANFMEETKVEWSDQPIDIAQTLKTLSEKLMSETGMPRVERHFKYRGVSFQLTANGHWIFYGPPKNSDSWERYATNDEIAVLCGPKINLDLTLSIVQKMIDRYLAGEVAYEGDLRHRYPACNKSTDGATPFVNVITR